MRADEGMVGQLRLKKADLAMNALHDKIKSKQQEMPDKMQDYLNTECHLPLPKYEDGGVFAGYIQNHGSALESQFKFRAATGIDESPARTTKQDKDVANKNNFSKLDDSK